MDLADGAQIGNAETYKVNETYPWYGAHIHRGEQLQWRQSRPDKSEDGQRPIRWKSGPTTTASRSATWCRARAPGRPTKPPYSVFRRGA